MKRKIVSVLMCATMTAALFAGCGGGGDTQASGDAAKTDDAANDAADDGASEAAGDDAAADDGASEAAGDDAAAGGSDGGTITIGFAQVGHESDWRTASTKSCQDVFSAENGYDLQFVDCDNDSAAQIEAVRGFIQQAVDYIIIDPIVSTGWDTVLTECEDAGIPVIIIDRTIDDSDKYVSWVGSNFKTEGLAAGEWLKAYAENKGISEINALVIEGSTGASATIGRTEGFKEIADANGWTIVDSQSGDFTEAGGQEVMESYIKSYEGKFNVVICQNDNEAFGAMTAMKNAGIEYGVGKDVILVSFDACTAGLEKVMSGDINADFECNPLAAPDVEKVIKQLQAGETPEKEVYMTEHWYVNEDVLSSITVNGEEQALTVVTQEIIDAQY
ncbi:ABC transporter substrate-binding protein [Lachnospiraceae bacterium 38-14]|uniref:ABC transporter substrate-binding protein n=1 Tax=Roseburia sp. 1XD42-69 TaxID=2320088 RepID=UPI000EA34EC6|nr:ABC transporter substrate-binding protein [Roseburia sp. 1XD42-69]MCX4319652.1 ABC transporter substrate-binding protein [Lachnospiraceae bacterium]RKJ63976.1 ABC transporter substrate-binding protein [Roseburia sp. 1XD42-69]